MFMEKSSIVVFFSPLHVAVTKQANRNSIIMRIVEIPSEDSIPNACCTDNRAYLSPNFDMEWREDETSTTLMIPMPGVRAKDVRISIDQGILSVCGNYSCPSLEKHRGSKRRRLNSLEFDVNASLIDSNRIDVHRAIANLFNETLILYAPKKNNSSLC